MDPRTGAVYRLACAGLALLLGVLVVVEVSVAGGGHESVDVLRQVHLVELHVARMRVVLAVRRLPREVGHKQE